MVGRWIDWDKRECEWSSLLVFTTLTQPFLTGVILEDVKMSSERYCFSELEKHISLEMLALHKNILKREEIDFQKKHGQTFTTLTFQYKRL